MMRASSVLPADFIEPLQSFWKQTHLRRRSMSRN